MRLSNLWNRRRDVVAARGESGRTRLVPRARQRSGYDAATVGDRLTAGWTSTPLTADQTIYKTLQTLRARSREQFQNNDYAKNYVQTARKDIVGEHGVRLQSGLIGPDGEPREVENNAIEMAWHRWGSPENADWSGELSFVEMQRLVVSSCAVDGEALIRVYTGEEAGPFGFQLQFIDPEQLDVHHNGIASNGNLIRMGIEYDKRERPVAYHLLEPAAVGTLFWAGYRSNMNRQRIPAADIIHVFVRERVGQRRGLPWMATALSRMRSLRKFEESALVNARVGASKMGFLQSPEGDRYKGTDKEDETGAQISDVEPGILEQLPAGVQFQGWNPTYPHEMYETFTKRHLQGIASGLGVPYNTFANDLADVNFSSIRAGTMDARDNWRVLQDWFKTNFVRRVFVKWIPWATLTSQIKTITGEFDATLMDDAIERATWQPRSWGWVEPKKDTESNVAQIQARMKSRSAAIREQGDDPEEVFLELAAEERFLNELGLGTGTQSTTSTTVRPGSTDDDDAEDAEVDDDDEEGSASDEQE